MEISPSLGQNYSNAARHLCSKAHAQWKQWDVRASSRSGGSATSLEPCNGEATHPNLHGNMVVMEDQKARSHPSPATHGAFTPATNHPILRPTDTCMILPSLIKINHTMTGTNNSRSNRSTPLSTSIEALPLNDQVKAPRTPQRQGVMKISSQPANHPLFMGSLEDDVGGFQRVGFLEHWLWSLCGSASVDGDNEVDLFDEFNEEVSHKSTISSSTSGKKRI